MRPRGSFSFFKMLVHSAQVPCVGRLACRTWFLLADVIYYCTGSSCGPHAHTGHQRPRQGDLPWKGSVDFGIHQKPGLRVWSLSLPPGCWFLALPWSLGQHSPHHKSNLAPLLKPGLTALRVKGTFSSCPRCLFRFSVC